MQGREAADGLALAISCAGGKLAPSKKAKNPFMAPQGGAYLVPSGEGEFGSQTTEKGNCGHALRALFHGEEH